MTFDPSRYETDPDFDMQKDPTLPDLVWVERFVAHLVKCGSPVADDGFKSDVESYARNVAASYLSDRKEYVDPEEAADTDISYWESEE